MQEGVENGSFRIRARRFSSFQKKLTTLCSLSSLRQAEPPRPLPYLSADTIFHTAYLIDSHKRTTGRPLMSGLTLQDAPKALFEARAARWHRGLHSAVPIPHG